VRDIKEYMIPPSMKVIEAMSAIDRIGEGIAFVCEEERLLGTLSDGDVRRHILRGGDLGACVSNVANPNFRYLNPEDISSAQEIMQRHKLRAIPVLDERDRLISICFANNVVVRSGSKLGLPVVIMAGGKGTRLHPYTKVLPKPLIPIGDIPITMHIMQNFAAYGCNAFTMIVNHQKELIKAYFSDIDAPFSVDYAEESKPLGTGGGLKLLEGRIETTFFMTNCDIIVEADYADIIRYHRKNENLVTMVCAVKKVTVPYGTVKLDPNGLIEDIVEKPTFSFLTNTGFYVVEPRVFDYIPEGAFIHITDIIERCSAGGERVGVYPVAESQWMDMGQLDEMEKMLERRGGRTGE
jgi:dTDP-glucose pyrophosphorylase